MLEIYTNGTRDRHPRVFNTGYWCFSILKKIRKTPEEIVRHLKCSSMFTARIRYLVRTHWRDTSTTFSALIWAFLFPLVVCETHEIRFCPQNTDLKFPHLSNIFNETNIWMLKDYPPVVNFLLYGTIRPANTWHVLFVGFLLGFLWYIYVGLSLTKLMLWDSCWDFTPETKHLCWDLTWKYHNFCRVFIEKKHAFMLDFHAQN
jgi:hypothetical protein